MPNKTFIVWKEEAGFKPEHLYRMPQELVTLYILFCFGSVICLVKNRNKFFKKTYLLLLGK